MRMGKTHLRVSLALIFFLRLSFVTSSPISSLRAYLAGGSRILRLMQSCLTTSSTVSVGSIRARTVTPSLVLTVLVGTKATDFAWLPLVEARGPRLKVVWEAGVTA